MKLGMEMKIMGYKPTTEVVMFDIEDEEKEHTLVHHSEKIAIAFSPVTTEPGESIRVTKNLRVCSDCHTAIRLISRITNREIIVRDTAYNLLHAIIYEQRHDLLFFSKLINTNG